MKILDFKETKYAIAYGMGLSYDERTELMLMYSNALLRLNESNTVLRIAQSKFIRDAIDAVTSFSGMDIEQQTDILRAAEEILKNEFVIEWVIY